MRQYLPWLLLIIWLALVVTGLYRFLTMAPDDMGFTRGLNRISAFISWQIAAAALALPIWMIGRRFETSALRLLFRVPLLWALALALVAVLLVATAWVKNESETREPALSPTPVPTATE